MTSPKAVDTVDPFLTTGDEAVRSDMTETFLKEGIQAVEAILIETVDSDVTVLREASEHILSAGGKRVRPRLVLMSYAASGGTDIDRVAPVAAAMELVHTASVVHDDINDHGVVRRGRPSINAVWGRTFALLTGDYLFTKVYELMAPYQKLNTILAEATVALVEGETLQASAVKENNFSREVYYQIIARKTAALFKASAKLGATLAGADEKTINGLAQYGYNVGLAFQIIDDILDLTGDVDKLGKTAGIDVMQGRGLAVAYSDHHTNGNGATVEPTAPSHDPIAIIQAKLADSDSLAEGHEQAQQLVHLAISNLRVLPDSPAKGGLIQLAHMVIDRDH